MVQRDTILAMDFMEGGSLWDLLPRTNKAGQRPFQFQHRQEPLSPCSYLSYHIWIKQSVVGCSEMQSAALRCKVLL